MTAQTTVSDDRDRRGLHGWRVIWTTTVFCYFLYGFFGGDLGIPWGPLTGVAIAGVIYLRWWLVHDTRWFLFSQTCMQGAFLLSLIQLYLIIHNLRTIQSLWPVLIGVGFVLVGWYIMLRQPKPRMEGWRR